MVVPIDDWYSYAIPVVDRLLVQLKAILKLDRLLVQVIAVPEIDYSITGEPKAHIHISLYESNTLQE